MLYGSRKELALSLFNRYNFLLKRLHSLTGVIPVGLFLLNHFYANAYAIKGEEAYNSHAQDILNLPYLFIVELVVIFIPLVFHAALGVLITFSGECNLQGQSWFRNWMYVLQRVSGAFLLIFISIHVFGTRFNPERSNLYELMAQHMTNPYYLAFYILGVMAATFHFSNGLWGFCVTWGVTVSPRSQRISTYACAGLFLVLTFVGVNSLLAFNGGGITFLNP